MKETRPIVIVRENAEQLRKLEAENEFLRACIEDMTNQRDAALEMLARFGWIAA